MPVAQRLRAVAGGGSLSPIAIYDARTLGLSDGAVVASWADGSGNGHTATQATAAKKPTYRATGINGHPGVEFVAASSQLLATAAFAFSGAWTMYAVASRNNAAAGTFGIANMDDGGSNRLWQFRFNAANAEAIAWNTAGLQTATKADAVTTAKVIAAVRTTTTVQVFVDGTGGTSQNLAGSVPQSGTLSLHIGEASQSAQYLDGFLGYVAVYQGAHGATTRQAIEATLKGAWGI